MQERREDPLFDRWRRDGSAAALAEVYDLTAPTLLRVALHFVREPAVAEDLVQATFLGAIENASAWDGTRPLLGWLAGILHNQAKWLLRREGRAVDAQRLPERIAPDPLAQAQAAEFTAQIDAAIERMPEAYRPVMRLHLKHQFRAAEIAHVLQRPAGTVRKQIVRGLEMLRGALPAGLTLAAFALVTPSRGLAAVREVVLLAGEAATAAALGTGGALLLLGAWTMKKTAIAAASVVLLAGVWMWWNSTRASRSAAREAASAASPQAAQTRAPTLTPTPSADTLSMTREVVDDTLVGWRLQGLVRHAGEQTPGAGATVTARMTFDGDPEPLAEATADAEGAFAIDLAPLRALPTIDLERVGIALTAWADGRCEMTANTALTHRDPERPMLLRQDFELVAGAAVIGRIVAEGGNPVSEAGVVLQPIGRDGGTALITADADSAGRYRLATPIAGTMILRAGHHAFGVGEAQVTAILGREVAAPDVVLHPRGTLKGRVTFEDGEPAGELDVVLFTEGAGEQEQSVATAITGADGRFELRTLQPGRYQPRVGSIHDLIDEGAQRWPVVATDQEEVHLVLRSVHLVRLRYEDEQGRPLRPLGISYGLWEEKHDAAFRAFGAGAPLPCAVEEDSRITGAGTSRPFLVHRGMWLWVHASHGLWRGETLVQAAPPRSVIDTVLRLRQREPTATLRLLLKSSDGRAFEDVEMRLNQTRLGEPGSPDLLPERTGKRHIYRWAPGQYRAEIWPKTVGFDFGWFEGFQQDVELREGTETVLERTLEPGGRVRFTVRLADREDRRAIQDFVIGTVQAGSWQPGPRSFVRTRPDGRGSGGMVVAGEAIVWQALLSAGRHELTVRSRDYRDAVISVTIEPRVVSDVDIWLQPR